MCTDDSVLIPVFVAKIVMYCNFFPCKKLRLKVYGPEWLHLLSSPELKA